MPTRSEKFSFPGSQGFTLDARLELPAEKPLACAVFAHCFTCSKDSLAAARISQRIAQQGIAVLRFDFSGLGGSQGDFANTNFSSNVQDLLYAISHLSEQFIPPTLLIGHSLGGTAAIVAATQSPQIQVVATIGSPAEPSHVTRLFAPQGLETLKTKKEADVQIAGRTFRIQQQFLTDITQQNLLEKLPNLNKPLLVMHSPVDEIVSISNATQLFMSARHPKSFCSLGKADHLLTQIEDAQWAADVIAAWASRFVTTSSTSPQQTSAPPPGQVHLQENNLPYTIDIQTNGHSLQADEPISLGGQDKGPNPYELLSASLGACTLITLRMYANHKKIPLEGMQLSIRKEKIHAQASANCQKPLPTNNFQRTLQFQGNLTAEQKQRLLEIADKCPVHQALSRPNQITTQLDES